MNGIILDISVVVLRDAEPDMLDSAFGELDFGDSARFLE
jgi:hypothetical protein